MAETKIITLDPHSEGGPWFDLAGLLALISEEGPKLHWRVAANCEGMEIFFEGGARGRSEEVVFSNAVESARNGLVVSWDELVDLGTRTRQTIWGAYFGFAEPEEPDLPMLLNGEWMTFQEGTPEFFARVTIALQAVDSSFWMIYARNEEVRARLEAAFGPPTGRQIYFVPYPLA